MPLKPRPLDRDIGVVRDASLVIIASEDRYAVKQYFSRFKPRRVQFQVLATEDGKSSPEHVLARLRDFAKEYDIGQEDELWLCLDVDHWAKSGHIQNLTSVLQQCKAAGYQIAFCLPCFELWLLLHYREIDASNLEGHSAASVYLDLKQHCCGFDKTKVDRLSLTADQVLSAIERAKLLPGDTMDIPTVIAAQTHRLLNRLVEKESIRIDPPPCQSGSK